MQDALDNIKEALDSIKVALDSTKGGLYSTREASDSIKLGITNIRNYEENCALKIQTSMCSFSVSSVHSLFVDIFYCIQ